MRILIIGAGAIGTFLGAYLAQAGETISLVGRTEFAHSVEATGLRVHDGEAHWTVHPAAIYTSIGEALAEGDFAVAMLTVKAYDTATVIKEIQAAAAPMPPILSWQNGVGNEKMLVQAFGARKVLAGALTTPVQRLAPGEIQVSKRSFHSGVASLDPVAKPLRKQVAAAMKKAGFTVLQVEDYCRLKWSKLLLNLVANAQSAILGWTPAQLFANRISGRLEILAWQEAFQVMARSGITPLPLGGYPLPMLAPILRHAPPGLLRPLVGWFVAGGRGSKYPSLYLDREANKKCSEVRWLNGAVVKAGSDLGLPTPVNQAFTSILEAILAGRLSPERITGQPEALAEVAERVAAGQLPFHGLE